ncbi:unnamed protein product, partial [Cyprideis torosa]
ENQILPPGDVTDCISFQAPCQEELETWVHSIHSSCAAAFARHRGKTGTLHLLQEEILRLEKQLESDLKIKQMSELQMSVVSDADSKAQINLQVMQYEENIERTRTEQFRLKCYMASLQGTELPNPKGLLSYVSRSTKSYLNRLGVFTVSSLHAYVCARSPSLLSNLLAGRGATKRRAPMLSQLGSSASTGSRRSLNRDEHLISSGRDEGGLVRESFRVRVPGSSEIATGQQAVEERIESTVLTLVAFSDLAHDGARIQRLMRSQLKLAVTAL